MSTSNTTEIYENLAWLSNRCNALEERIRALEDRQPLPGPQGPTGFTGPPGELWTPRRAIRRHLQRRHNSRRNR